VPRNCPLPAPARGIVVQQQSPYSRYGNGSMLQLERGHGPITGGTYVQYIPESFQLGPLGDLAALDSSYLAPCALATRAQPRLIIIVSLLGEDQFLRAGHGRLRWWLNLGKLLKPGGPTTPKPLLLSLCRPPGRSCFGGSGQSGPCWMDSVCWPVGDPWWSRLLGEL
jgi:hypothetical protein